MLSKLAFRFLHFLNDKEYKFIWFVYTDPFVI